MSAILINIIPGILIDRGLRDRPSGFCQESCIKIRNCDVTQFPHERPNPREHGPFSSTTMYRTTAFPRARGRPPARANSTKNPSPRIDPRERPADPGWNGKEGTKARIKKEPNAQVLRRKTSILPPDDRQTPARRKARNHRSEDAGMLGPLPSGPQRTGRADQRDARGDANRDRYTPNHRRRFFFAPRSDREAQTTKERPR